MIVSPSILAADFGNLSGEIAMLNESAADWIHLDIMDGVFVPNISFGFPVMKAVRALTEKPLDVHLMIVDPQRYITRVRDIGATSCNVHQEACTHLHRTVESIREAGMKAAVTLNPATPVETLTDILYDLDMVLIMSVNPGFGGQKFIGHTVEKIKRLRRLIAETGSKAIIEVDGGINVTTGALCAEAGADAVVAGHAIFGDADPKRVIASLKEL